MGRRSTKTTKTGKFMNPTDQWRKQIRKKELKKNRQQRSAVREAVLKNKNPATILAEIEEIEKMEIEAGPEELPAEKGLKEKKRKLHETLQRIILFNERQNPQEAQQIKDLVTESEKKRRAMSKVYNSYRSARSQIELSDIPLPEGTAAAEGGEPPRRSDEKEDFSSVRPPGPPPGTPPNIQFPLAITLSDNESDDDRDDDEDDEDDSENDEQQQEADYDNKETMIPPPPPPGLPPNYTTHPLPLFPPMATTTHYPPPPPPPGVPPSQRSHPPPLPSLFKKTSPHIQSIPVSSNQAPVISAQPQLRNVQAEVTKFMPTSLRVRRDQPKAIKAKMRTNNLSNESLAGKRGSGSLSSGRSLVQGDAYETFMAEMQGLL